MKIIFLSVFILSLVLMISGIIVFQTDIMKSTTLNFVSEIIHVSVIIIILIIGIVLVNKRRRVERVGLTADDELSKRILCKTGLISFYGSIILWLILIYVQMYTQIFKGLAFSYGFIGMALIFLVTWTILNIKGIHNE